MRFPPMRATFPAVLTSLFCGCSPPTPSILVVLLDDARPDELPTLARDGLQFRDAYVTSPSCGPSRANFLTGRFRSSRINGWPDDFDDSDTVATRLQAAGYTTGYFGKYLNGSSQVGLDEPAPGWDRWQSLRSPVVSYRFSTLDEMGAVSSPEGHVDVWMLEQVMDWLGSAPEPKFAIFATHGPHTDGFGPVVPPDGYRSRLSGPYDARLRAMEYGLFFADAVDQLRERFPDLVIVLASDNGLARGESGWFGKACPYHACVHIPLVIFGSTLPNERLPGPVVLEDVTATILALAGADASGLDGCNLLERRGFRCRQTVPFPDGGSIFGLLRWEATLSRNGMTIHWDPRDSDRGEEFLALRQWRPARGEGTRRRTTPGRGLSSRPTALPERSPTAGSPAPPGR